MKLKKKFNYIKGSMKNSNYKNKGIEIQNKLDGNYKSLIEEWNWKKNNFSKMNKKFKRMRPKLKENNIP